MPWQKTWSLNRSEEATAFGHWQTGSIQPTDRGVFALHWPDRDKAEIITLLDTSHGGNFDPSGHCCSLSMLLQLIRAAPINSFPGQSLIKYWWLSQLFTKCAFVCSERTYSCIKLTINLYILFKKCNFGFLSNPNPIILDFQVSLLWTIAKKFW